MHADLNCFFLCDEAFILVYCDDCRLRIELAIIFYPFIDTFRCITSYRSPNFYVTWNDNNVHLRKVVVVIWLSNKPLPKTASSLRLQEMQQYAVQFEAQCRLCSHQQTEFSPNPLRMRREFIVDVTRTLIYNNDWSKPSFSHFYRSQCWWAEKESFLVPRNDTMEIGCSTNRRSIAK